MEDSILGLAELQAEGRPVELGKHWGILGGGGRALSQSGDKLTWQGRGGTGRERGLRVTPRAARQRGHRAGERPPGDPRGSRAEGYRQGEGLPGLSQGSTKAALGCSQTWLHLLLVMWPQTKCKTSLSINCLIF